VLYIIYEIEKQTGQKTAVADIARFDQSCEVRDDADLSSSKRGEEREGENKSKKTVLDKTAATTVMKDGRTDDRPPHKREVTYSVEQQETFIRGWNHSKPWGCTMRARSSKGRTGRSSGWDLHDSSEETKR